MHKKCEGIQVKYNELEELLEGYYNTLEHVLKDRLQYASEKTIQRRHDIIMECKFSRVE